MTYERLSKNALWCMYTATAIGSIVILVILGVANYFFFFPEDIFIGKIVSAVASVFVLANMLISPYFRYCRYRYSINEDSIDLKEGYLFVTRQVVPIERLHKLETNKGPIDRMFKVSKVVVTTGGGDVTLRFLDEDKVDQIVDGLKKRINDIVVEQKQEEEDGGE